MAERADAFRAFRIEEEDGKPKGRMTEIGLSNLNDGELVIRVGYSNLNYKDALAATGAAKIARRLPTVGGIDVAGTVVSSEDPSFEEEDEVLVTGFGLSEDRDGGYAEYARLKAEHALKIPGGLDAERAMAMGTAGLSVARMEKGGLSPDKGPVAVTGATGGVGSLAVDMLSDLGYEVVAITGKGGARIPRGPRRERGPPEAEDGDGRKAARERPVGRGGGYGRGRNLGMADAHRQEGREDSRLRECRRGELRDHRDALHLAGRGPPRDR
jgi:D-arabinose 1-dehydrogenase-like Zn-dependent alcohol dehydrogenase